MRILPVLSLLFVLQATAPAFAQRDATYDDAIAKAVVEFDHGNWEEARVLFRRAHDANPNARTWRSLGITAFELRRYVDAIAEFEAALADPRKPLTAKQRDEVQDLLGRAREFISVYRVRVRPDDAEVLVDGKVAALKDGKLFLDPGEHTVVVRARGYQERREDLNVSAGAQEELSLELSVVDSHPSPTNYEPPPAESEDEAKPIEPAPEESPRRVMTWTLLGSSLAVAGVAAGTGLGARSKAKDYRSCEESCGAIKTKGQRLQLTTNVALGVSGALLLGAVTAFFLEGDSDKPEPRTAFWVAPDSVGLSHRF